MSETPNLTPEQKEKNKQYLLNHFDEYVVDIHGNYVNVFDFEGTYGTDYFYIGKDSLPSECFQEIENKSLEEWQKGQETRKKLGEKILRELENWELVYFVYFTGMDDNLKYVRHKQSGIELNADSVDFESYYKIIGELGYRKNIWENYKETIKNWKEREKLLQENMINNNNNQPPQPQNGPNKKPDQQQPSQNQNNPPSNQEKQPDNPKNQSNNNPSPNKEGKKDNPTNSLPRPSEIQNNYNSDKSKTEIEDNSNLTTPESKEQANELLKTIISAELLIKKKQFNSELLTKLITEKQNNTSLYQLLNKEGRIDKVINHLEKVKKEQEAKSNKSSPKNKTSSQIPVEVIVASVFFLIILIMLGIVIWMKRRKKINN